MGFIISTKNGLEYIPCTTFNAMFKFIPITFDTMYISCKCLVCMYLSPIIPEGVSDKGSLNIPTRKYIFACHFKAFFRIQLMWRRLILVKEISLVVVRILMFDIFKNGSGLLTDKRYPRKNRQKMRVSPF